MTHQNAILLLHAVDINKKYTDLMDMIVCNRENKQCMIHRCEKYPGTEPLKMFLFDALEKEEGDVCFQQWQATDNTKLLNQTLNICDFVDLVVETIDSLTTHSFIAKSQARYLKKRKEELLEDSAIVLGDFAENYSFVVQDEVQSFHWSKQSCTLHPLVVYVRENGELIQKSFCAISDDLEHDSSLVHQIQKEISQQIKSNFPQVTKVEYFSDGCAAQYKNCRNFLNLTFHHQDFGLSACWSFFASSHGKSPCDGIGGAVKRLVARASLQRPYSNQILSARSMLDFCNQSITNISFLFISKEEMVPVRVKLKDRYTKSSTIPGTRSFHFLSRFDPTKLLISVLQMTKMLLENIVL